MLGVLVVEHHGQVGYLQAYSGQMDFSVLKGTPLAGVEAEFVPPVVDYLQPEGYFKVHEKAIVELGKHIEKLENSPELALTKTRIAALEKREEEDVSAWKSVMEAAKRRRDETRLRGDVPPSESEKMIKESQYQRAELRRIRLNYAAERAKLQHSLGLITGKIRAFRETRKAQSDSLQRWLFAKFVMVNALGERRSLIDLFAAYYKTHAFSPAKDPLPPSGSGECCEPKLLQYAYLHGMKPLSMAMFWWGKSPEGELRRHGSFYPACQSKCRPVLPWMLKGLDTDPFPPAKDLEESLETLYEDGSIAVLNKPSGMLSVPGKGPRKSVFSIMKARYPEATGPVIVHRLDMDTSGLMVVAKTMEAYIDLQKQFAGRQVGKTYIALLAPLPPEESPKALEGTIALPLRGDIDDRPRQLVDRQHGKSAVTRYAFLDRDTVLLTPLTGRTHQLRVHCAHPEGLGRAIQGDPLYGQRGGRMCLHAMRITFKHPADGRTMQFEKAADFIPARE